MNHAPTITIGNGPTLTAVVIGLDDDGLPVYELTTRRGHTYRTQRTIGVGTSESTLSIVKLDGEPWTGATRHRLTDHEGMVALHKIRSFSTFWPTCYLQQLTLLVPGRSGRTPPHPVCVEYLSSPSLLMLSRLRLLYHRNAEVAAGAAHALLKLRTLDELTAVNWRGINPAAEMIIRDKIAATFELL